MLHNITAEAQQLSNSRYMTHGLSGGGACGGAIDLTASGSGGACYDTMSMTFTPYAPAASIQRYFPASHVAGSGSHFTALNDGANAMPPQHHVSQVASQDAMMAAHHAYYSSQQQQQHHHPAPQQQQPQPLHHARLSATTAASNSHRGSTSPLMGSLSTLAPSAPVYGPSSASPYQQFVDVVSGASLTIDDDDILLQRSGYALSPASLAMPQVAVGVPKRLTFSYDGENYTASQPTEQASPTTAPTQGCPCPTCIPSGRGASPHAPPASSPFSNAMQQVPSPTVQLPSNGPSQQLQTSAFSGRAPSGAALSAPAPLASVDHVTTDSSAVPSATLVATSTPTPQSKQGKQALEAQAINQRDAPTPASQKSASKSATHKPSPATAPAVADSPKLESPQSTTAPSSPAQHGVFQVEVQLHHNRTTSIVSHLPLVRGAYVVYEGDRGVDMGVVKSVSPLAPGKIPAAGIPMVVRSASKDEIERWTVELPKLAAEAVAECASLVSSMKLKMRVREASYQLDKQKLTFFYETSESRVDFRKLLIELFNRYRCRIWMEKHSMERLGSKE